MKFPYWHTVALFVGAAGEIALLSDRTSTGWWRIAQYRIVWSLWEKDMPLVKWFNERGITHADDMSAIILTSIWRRVHGMDLDIEGQIKSYAVTANVSFIEPMKVMKVNELNWLYERPSGFRNTTLSGSLSPISLT
jgi:hypothetical protein